MDFGVVDRDERKQRFLDFLDEPEQSARRIRPGAYAAYSFGNGKRKVKVILLDTRYFRSAHAIPSVGALFPRVRVMPVLASFSRWVASASGLTARHQGTLLGEEQWRWLNDQLRDSDAAIHIIVSSVQVFTTNPLFEGWGHFPRAKRRLVRLVQKHHIDTKGLLFLSGDVHAGELIGGDASAALPAEVTSSGLTHSCTAGGIPHIICRTVWGSFASHRATPNDYYLGRNFGTIDVDWASTPPIISATIHDEYGNVQLALRRAADARVPLEDIPLDGLRQLIALVVVSLCFVAGLFYFFRQVAAPRRKKKAKKD